MSFKVNFVSNASAERPVAEPDDRERQVIEFLHDHPDLLRRHPELLDHLEPPGGEAAAVSLVEYQLRRARKRLGELEARLKNLIDIARANESLLLRLHQVHLDLGSCAGLELLDKLDGALCADFAIDAWCVLAGNETLGGVQHPRLKRPGGEPLLDALLAAPRPHCGRLTAAKRQALFGAAEIASAALAPLPHGGLLALGSRDPARFTPEADTLLLKLLGLTLARRLPLAPATGTAAG